MFTSCSPAKLASASATRPLSSIPDYTKLEYWAAHPAKTDPSDRLPSAIGSENSVDSSVVVFFVHPTTLTDYGKPEWNADLTDEELNKKTDDKPILYQATAFNQYPIYAPRYRQAHIRSYFTSDSVNARHAFKLAYEDVRNAFLEFLRQAHGRPVIIASHSQGSTHVIHLLQEFFDTTNLQKQLVVAYVVGMRIPDNFRNLRMCNDSTATGCLVGWRTYREGYVPEFVEKETGSPMITNPLTWSSLPNEEAPTSLNKGAVLTKFDKLFYKAADARIHDRVLWVSELNFPGSFLVRKKNLHVGDINLFWMNIRDNCTTRVSSYRKQHYNLSISNGETR